jgi:hypothetical protein
MGNVKNIFKEIIEGTVSRDFILLVFSSNCTPGSSDSGAKAVSNKESYSLSYSKQKSPRVV